MRNRALKILFGLLAASAAVAAAPPGPPSPDAKLIQLALTASSCAESRGLVPRPELVTIIDYSRPSTETRLWVLERSSRRVLYRELVTHGQGTGERVAEHFSNRPGSHQSSLGLFVTGKPYQGRNGYSLRLEGLETGVNDRSHERAIVIHGAPYATVSFAVQHGRLGRSHGCPAVRTEVAKDLIDEIEGGSTVFAYSPDGSWLASSEFLNGCHDTTAVADRQAAQ